MWDWIQNKTKQAIASGKQYVTSWTLIENLLLMSSNEALQELQIHLYSLNKQEFDMFRVVLMNQIQQAQQSLQNHSSWNSAGHSWGPHFEDQYAQFLAEVQCGPSPQQSQAIQQAQMRLEGLQTLSTWTEQIHQQRCSQ